MKNNQKETRRSFLKKVMATSTLSSSLYASLTPRVLNANTIPKANVLYSANDRLRFATIGMGIIGFADTRAALEIPGVEFVAAADLYSSRLVRTREIFGNNIFTTRDYREILAKPDIDAVIVSTSDHWHAQITMDALTTGKAVYCEKPMVHELKEGPQVIQTQKKTGKVLEVGSQRVSSIIYTKAGELIKSGKIGKLNLVEARIGRNSSIGAWQYSLPPDASPRTIEWDRFLGKAPKRPFDPVRFFRWRNYWDYGTGIPGDLYVHLFSGIHYILESNGPNQIMSTGGIRYWEDGREVPDIMLGVYNYPETQNHPEFSLSLQTNLADGSGGESSFRFVGNEGALTLKGGSILLEQNAPEEPSEDNIVKGYNSVYTFSTETQEKFVEEYRKIQSTKRKSAQLDSTVEYQAPQGYSDRNDHFYNFFEAIRTGDNVVEDAVFGFRAAAPALLSNESYLKGKVIGWNPDKMELIT
jgi:predicted dehydrogenase